MSDNPIVEMSDPEKKRFIDDDPKAAFCYGWGSACADISEMIRARGFESLADVVEDLAKEPDLDRWLIEDSVEARVAELELNAQSKSCLCGDWPQQSPWLYCPWCGGTLSAAHQPAADHKCSECGFAHAPGGNSCCSR